MIYSVKVMPQAAQDLEEAFSWLLRESPGQAPAWYNGILDSIVSLEEFPARCPLAPESKDSPEELRQLLHGNKQHAYRIVFAIRGSNVIVLTVRHAARNRP